MHVAVSMLPLANANSELTLGCVYKSANSCLIYITNAAVEVRKNRIFLEYNVLSLKNKKKFGLFIVTHCRLSVIVLRFCFQCVVKTGGVHLLSRPRGSRRQLHCLSGDGTCWLHWGRFRLVLFAYLYCKCWVNKTISILLFFLYLVGRPDPKRGEPHTGHLHCPRWHRMCWTQRVPQRQCTLHQVRDNTLD